MCFNAEKCPVSSDGWQGSWPHRLAHMHEETGLDTESSDAGTSSKTCQGICKLQCHKEQIGRAHV